MSIAGALSTMGATLRQPSMDAPQAPRAPQAPANGSPAAATAVRTMSGGISPQTTDPAITARLAQHAKTFYNDLSGSDEEVYAEYQRREASAQASFNRNPGIWGGSSSGTPAPASDPASSPSTGSTSSAPASASGGIAPTSAAAGLDGILASNSPLMRRAEQSGFNTANKRGLLNSSVAAEAAQGAMIDRATPIAMQDAQTSAQERMQGKDIDAQMERLREQGRITGQQQSADSAAQMERLKLTLQNSDSQQAKAISAELQRLDLQIKSAEGQQKRDLEAQRERLLISGELEIGRISLQGNITSILQSQGAEQDKAKIALQGQISSALQAQGDASTMARLKATFDQETARSQQEQGFTLERIKATGDQNLRQLVQQQEGSLRELQLNIAAGDRANIAKLSVEVFQAESQVRAYLLNNTSIPASERSGYEAAISSLGSPVRAYLNALYGGSAPAGIAPAPANAPVSGGGIAPVGFAA